ncbi:MAG: bacterioferritin [Gammaproteobacteria bacterium]|nr:bacterioferritin [Gammaproteobacteria bacterium]
MKTDPQMIQHLNNVLGNELVAINQYFLHSKILKNWGINKLAEKEHEESIDEMKHADKLSDRILFLDGLPNFQSLGKLYIGQNVKEILECDLKLEYKAREDLISAIKYAESIADFPSRVLLESIMISEEGHIDFLLMNLELINKIGIENYIQSNI